MALLGLGSGQNARPLGTLLLDIGTIFFKLDFLAACVGPFDIQCNFFIKKRENIIHNKSVTKINKKSKYLN